MRASILRTNILTLSLAALIGLFATTSFAQAQLYRYRAPSYQVTPYSAYYQSPQTAVYRSNYFAVSPSVTTYSTLNYYPAVSPYGYVYPQPVVTQSGFYTPPYVRPYLSPYPVTPTVPSYYQFWYTPY